MGYGTAGGARGCQPQWSENVAMVQGGVFSLLQSAYRPETTRVLVDYTGRGTSHFIEGFEVNQSQRGMMSIFFTPPIQHGSDPLHLAPAAPQHWIPHTM